MPLFSREKSSLKGRWRLETVQDMRSSGSNPVSCSETSIKIYGSKEEIRARKSPETVDAPGFAPDASIPVTLYGPSDRIRTCGILLPKQARYQLRYTRLFSFLSGWAYSPKAGALPAALHPDIQFFLHDTMRRRKKQVFRVCGRRCGQARFCESFSTREFPPQATVPKASGSSLSGKWIGYLSSQKGRHTTNCANLEQTVSV